MREHRRGLRHRRSRNGYRGCGTRPRCRHRNAFARREALADPAWCGRRSLAAWRHRERLQARRLAASLRPIVQRWALRQRSAAPRPLASSNWRQRAEATRTCARVQCVSHPQRSWRGTFAVGRSSFRLASGALRVGANLRRWTAWIDVLDRRLERRNTATMQASVLVANEWRDVLDATNPLLRVAR